MRGAANAASSPTYQWTRPNWRRCSFVRCSTAVAEQRRTAVGRSSWRQPGYQSASSSCSRSPSNCWATTILTCLGSLASTRLVYVAGELRRERKLRITRDWSRGRLLRGACSLTNQCSSPDQHIRCNRYLIKDSVILVIREIVNMRKLIEYYQMENKY